MRGSCPEDPEVVVRAESRDVHLSEPLGIGRSCGDRRDVCGDTVFTLDDGRELWCLGLCEGLRDSGPLIVLLGADDDVADPHLPGHEEEDHHAGGEEELAEYTRERRARAWSLPPRTSPPGTTDAVMR